MYHIFRTSSFKKDYKKLSTTDKTSLKAVVIQLVNGKKLDKKYQDHQLLGHFSGYRECHLKPDLLLIYAINHPILELSLVRIGSHSKLFKK